MAGRLWVWWADCRGSGPAVGISGRLQVWRPGYRCGGQTVGVTSLVGMSDMTGISDT